MSTTVISTSVPGKTAEVVPTPPLSAPSKEVLSARLCDVPKNPPTASW